MNISTAPGGTPAGSWSDSPVVSANGHSIAFVSAASNLVNGDTNSGADVFLYDRTNNQTALVSISSNGEQGNGWSYQPAISANGRYIAFTSLATNLVPENRTLPQRAHIFVRDLLKNQTSLVSVNSEGEAANGWSEWPSISGNGRFVAFTSLSDNLVAGDDNHTADAFVRDRLTGQTERIPIPVGDGLEKRWVMRPTISSDGRYVTFIAVSSDPQASARIFLHDRLTGETAQVPGLSQGFSRVITRSGPAISADGGELVFTAREDNQEALYIYRRNTNQLIRIATSQQAIVAGIQFAISANGRYVAYRIPNQDTDWRLYLYDQLSDQSTVLGNGSQNGSHSNTWNQVGISADGSILALAASGLQAAGGNISTAYFQDDQPGIFVYERGAGEKPTTFASGWVSDGMGHPLAGVTISDEYQHRATTGKDGSFRIDGLTGGSYTLTPSKKGYTFSPLYQRISAAPDRAGATGVAFTAAPEDVIKEARKDIGMPYAMTRGCPSPYKECGGPFHGFYSGDCTDLVMDAYKEGLGFNIQLALERDFWTHPDHYYRWRDARSSQDMWRYFAYSGQILDHATPYQPGDIVFFDWEGDGVTDHVSIISEVSSRGRPRKMIDASGVIDENPGGLAAELDWMRYHDASVQGHVRWSGTARPQNSPIPKDGTFLVVALDSPKVTMRLFDDQGQAIQAGGVPIAGATYTNTGSGAVIAVSSPENHAEWYFIEITSQAPAPYQLGIQTMQARTVTAAASYQRSIGAGDTQLIPVRLHQEDGRLTFVKPTLPDEQELQSETLGSTGP